MNRAASRTPSNPAKRAILPLPHSSWFPHRATAVAGSPAIRPDEFWSRLGL